MQSYTTNLARFEREVTYAMQTLGDKAIIGMMSNLQGYTKEVPPRHPSRVPPSPSHRPWHFSGQNEVLLSVLLMEFCLGSHLNG